MGLGLLASAVFLAAFGLAHAGSTLLSWYRVGVRLFIGIRRLRHLTSEEKKVLRYYLDNETRTQALSYTDGVVQELEGSHIIRRASNVAQMLEIFPYNLQPWAWRYLRKHPELVRSDERERSG